MGLIFYQSLKIDSGLNCNVHAVISLTCTFDRGDKTIGVTSVNLEFILMSCKVSIIFCLQAAIIVIWKKGSDLH